MFLKPNETSKFIIQFEGPILHIVNLAHYSVKKNVKNL